MTPAERVAARLARKQARAIEKYHTTAARLLIESDVDHGVPVDYNADWVAYLDDPDLRGCVVRAMGQVKPCHVPRRAVKLYASGERVG